jgi:FtsZ-binding cell division protein ZapB
MATKRSGRTKLRPWTKQDVRELKEHSRSKSPVKKIAGAMKRTVGALRQKAQTWQQDVRLLSDFGN